MDTVIFLSGFALPEFISKSSLFFDEKSWIGYNTIFYQSKLPSSDAMIEDEIDHLSNLINNHPNSHIVGHSLGGWWGANVAAAGKALYKKMIFWTPLGIAGVFPFFNTSVEYESFALFPKAEFKGKNKNLVVYAKNDLIVPYKTHSIPLISNFEAESIALHGGHAFQLDHFWGLAKVKQWLKI